MATSVVYWSGTGNTQTMAESIAKGISQGGNEANLMSVDEVNVEALLSEPAFALGCPAMGDEVLEEGEMEPFIEAIEGKINGKNILLFGSYDWGDGGWMRDWVERMKNANANVITGDGIIANNDPDDEAKNLCENAGKSLAESI